MATEERFSRCIDVLRSGAAVGHLVAGPIRPPRASVQGTCAYPERAATGCHAGSCISGPAGILPGSRTAADAITFPPLPLLSAAQWQGPRCAIDLRQPDDRVFRCRLGCRTGHRITGKVVNAGSVALAPPVVCVGSYYPLGIRIDGRYPLGRVPRVGGYLTKESIPCEDGNGP